MRRWAKGKETGTEDAHNSYTWTSTSGHTRISGDWRVKDRGKGGISVTGCSFSFQWRKSLELYSNDGYTTLNMPNATSCSLRWEGKFIRNILAQYIRVYTHINKYMCVHVYIFYTYVYVCVQCSRIYVMYTRLFFRPSTSSQITAQRLIISSGCSASLRHISVQLF